MHFGYEHIKFDYGKIAFIMNDDDLNKIDIIIQDYYKRGEQNTFSMIPMWQTDLNYFSVLQHIIESCKFSPMFTHFAITSIGKLIEANYASWNVSSLLNILKWCLNILFNNVDWYYENIFVLTGFCATCATLIKLGWHVSPKFREFFDYLSYFFEGNVKQCMTGVMICTFTVEKMVDVHKMKTIQIKNFQETTMLDCFKFAVTTMKKIEQNGNKEIQNLMKSVLDLEIVCLSEKCFSQNNDKISQDIEKICLYLPESWNIVDFVELLSICFDIYKNWDEEIQKLALQLIFKISSITTKSRTPTEESRIIYYINLLSNISDIIENKINFSVNHNYVNIHFLINIIVRTKVSLEDDLIDKIFDHYIRFVKSVNLLTNYIFNVDFYTNASESIINILKIWEKIVDYFIIVQTKKNQFNVDNDLQEVDKMVLNTLKLYISLLQNLVTDNVSEENLFNLINFDLVQFSNFIQPITRIGRIIGRNFYDFLFSKFEEYLNIYAVSGSIISEYNLFLFSLIIASPIYYKLQDEDNEIQSFCLLFLLKLFDITPNSNRIIIEKLINYLVSQIQKSRIIQSSLMNSTMPIKIHQNTNFKNVDEILLVFYRRLLQIFVHFPNDSDLIYCTISTIFEAVSNNLISNSQIISSFIISTFLDFNNNDQVSFLSYLPNKLSRIKYFQIIIILITQVKSYEAFHYVFEYIENKIAFIQNNNDETQVYFLFYDLKGIFIGIINPNIYEFLISWIYPFLLSIQKIVFLMPCVINEYLKLLIVIETNKESRIRFSQHSAQGIKLFKIFAESILKIFTSLSKNIESSHKILTNIMQLITLMLMNNYSYVGAFEVYGDPILNNLFISFLEYLKSTKYIEILHYQKSSLTLLNLLQCLCERFISQVVKLEVNFVDIALNICLNVDLSSNNMIYKVLNVISLITEFCISNLNTEFGKILISNTHDSYNKILKMFEELIYKVNEKLNFRITNLLERVLLLKPDNWPVVKQKLMLFMNYCENEEQRAIYEHLLSI